MAYEGQPAKMFADSPIVQQHIDLATRYVADSAADLFRRGTEGVLRHLSSLQFDSVLEVMFWVWWNASTHPGHYYYEMLDLRAQQEVTVGSQLFRVDFLVEPADDRIAGSPDWQPIAVEVDGHAFHERTPEQVALRDRRDRALQAAGWRVFHFSYREFTEHPIDSVAEVIEFARTQVNRVSMLHYQSQMRAERANASRSTSSPEVGPLPKGESLD